MHPDAGGPDASAKLNILLGATGRICDNNLTRLHLIHLHAQGVKMEEEKRKKAYAVQHDREALNRQWRLVP